MTTPEQDPDREALARAWENGYRTAWRRARGLLREDESPLNPYREPVREGRGGEGKGGSPKRPDDSDA